MRANSSSSSNSVGKKPKFKYSARDNAPFVVYIYAKNSNPAKPMHPLHISKLITNIIRDSNAIREIKKIGRGKISAEFNLSAAAANNITTSPVLESYNLEAFIPAYRTLKVGIIKDVPIDLEEDVIQKEISSLTQILEVKRFKRRTNVNGETQFTPSTTVCVKFAGQVLSKFIYLYKIRHEVTLYIPRTKTCFNCYRTGHISANCRGKARCLYCGKDRHTNLEECANKDKPLCCINCKGTHTAISQACPAIAHHKSVAALAAAESIPISEARKRIFNNLPPYMDTAHNSVHLDPRFDFNNYPLINPQSPTPMVHYHNHIHCPKILMLEAMVHLTSLIGTGLNSCNMPPKR